MVAEFARTHTARAPGLIEPYAVEQVAGPGMKPKGLWYEVDGDWRRWCSDAGMEWGSGPLHRVELGDEELLFIRTVKELDRFQAEFIIREHVEDGMFGPIDLDVGIRWADVAARWDGIEIAPYQWRRRLAPGFTWYYGWDCASGVIWRPKGVRLEPLTGTDAGQLAPSNLGGSDG